MKEKFTIVQCDESEKTSFAAGQLQDSWWHHYVQCLPTNTRVQWRDFKEFEACFVAMQECFELDILGEALGDTPTRTSMSS